MRLLAISLQRTPEGLEMRARYGYDASKRIPNQNAVKTEAAILLQNALNILEAGQMEKAGLQREGMSEERATMSFTQKKGE